MNETVCIHVKRNYASTARTVWPRNGITDHVFSSMFILHQENAPDLTPNSQTPCPYVSNPYQTAHVLEFVL